MKTQEPAWLGSDAFIPVVRSILSDIGPSDDLVDHTVEYHLLDTNWDLGLLWQVRVDEQDLVIQSAAQPDGLLRINMMSAKGVTTMVMDDLYDREFLVNSLIDHLETMTNKEIWAEYEDVLDLNDPITLLSDIFSMDSSRDASTLLTEFDEESIGDILHRYVEALFMLGGDHRAKVAVTVSSWGLDNYWQVLEEWYSDEVEQHWTRCIEEMPEDYLRDAAKKIINS